VTEKKEHNNRPTKKKEEKRMGKKKGALEAVIQISFMGKPDWNAGQRRTCNGSLSLDDRRPALKKKKGY